MPTPEGRRPVPVRTILATIGLVLATLAAIFVLREISRVLGWLLVAAFFAVVLTPPVDYLAAKGVRRGLATMVVFFLGIVVFGGLMYAFVRPIVDRADEFIETLPAVVEDAGEGRGAVGRLVTRFNIDDYIQENQQELEEALQRAGAPALDLARSILNTAFALVTILVLAFLMILQGPQITSSVLKLVSDQHRERVRLVARDCSRAVTGYVAGNLLISIVAGVATFGVLAFLGVPYPAVLALWVAFADMIPMVGATLGAIPTIGFAFLHSTPAGIVAVIFYVVYQQFENHFLQPAVMSRTVNVSPLAVLVSVLVGVEVFGILGALLAIPATGVIQVIVRDLYGGADHPLLGIGADGTLVAAASPADLPPGGAGSDTEATTGTERETA